MYRAIQKEIIPTTSLFRFNYFYEDILLKENLTFTLTNHQIHFRDNDKHCSFYLYNIISIQRSNQNRFFFKCDIDLRSIEPKQQVMKVQKNNNNNYFIIRFNENQSEEADLFQRQMTRLIARNYMPSFTHIARDQQFVIDEILQNNFHYQNLYKMLDGQIDSKKLKKLLFSNHPSMLEFRKKAETEAYEKQKQIILSTLKEQQNRLKDGYVSQTSTNNSNAAQQLADLRNMEYSMKEQGNQNKSKEALYSLLWDKSNQQGQQMIFDAYENDKEQPMELQSNCKVVQNQQMLCNKLKIPKAISEDFSFLKRQEPKSTKSIHAKISPYEMSEQTESFQTAILLVKFFYSLLTGKCKDVKDRETLKGTVDEVGFVYQLIRQFQKKKYNHPKAMLLLDKANQNYLAFKRKQIEF